MRGYSEGLGLGFRVWGTGVKSDSPSTLILSPCTPALRPLNPKPEGPLTGIAP